ncbi:MULTISPECIES: TetR/AcrR family transcriptional regulator [Clostridium]|uniref:TetR/AcrR family transcriptional regulator n=1 Tax=Clostridium aquiflavi TaxID=3073603 RepID=A0ABU1EDD4_9CLOT|nr:MULTISPECIES: TetR/AcrR family transcriptional regulator [unclassified Clostridium]MDR5586377.1 TetR/AcrR family transcriptional regulator [Clostridium sp. 5N-1]NFG61383.1 TetR/AcrR family transcriptional regulator [Clostridium botulinum]NFQ09146.1 TetR/AcrR family transcriptional regulator [Clostridium botulinum]
MPLIFDEETKKHLRKQMLENGFQLIKLYGLKRTTVEDITKKSGVAKGTFYNFFKNKEDFVYEIIIFKRDKAKEEFQNLLDESKQLNRAQLKKYLEILVFGDYNLFVYLNDAEIAMLKARWPQEYLINEKNDENTSLWILKHINNISENCNWKVFSNYIKSIAIIQVNKEQLHKDAYKETLEHFINNILDYVFI